MEKKVILSMVIPSSVAVLVLLLAVIFLDYFVFLFFILPAFPIIYGCITKEKLGSILIGVLPIMGFFIGFIVLAASEISGTRSLYAIEIFYILIYMIAISGIPGLEGYFSSKREILPLLIAICLYVLWFRILYTLFD